MSTRREVRSRVPGCRRSRRPDGGGLVSVDEDSDSAVGSGDVDPGPVADGFRVRVSLERFFTDERARVLVWAERARSAGWLLRRLRTTLPLPDNAALALIAGDCLLPPAEPLAVLRPDDLLQVIISSSVKVPAVEETRDECDVGDELEAVKRRALSMLDGVEASEELAAAPRRRRRVRRRRAALPPAGDHDEDVDGATTAPPTPSQWRAELDAGAGVVRSATPPRAARLVSAAH